VREDEAWRSSGVGVWALSAGSGRGRAGSGDWLHGVWGRLLPTIHEGGLAEEVDSDPSKTLSTV